MFKEENYIFPFLLLKNSLTASKSYSFRDDTLIFWITSFSSQHFLFHPQEFSLILCLEWSGYASFTDQEQFLVSRNYHSRSQSYIFLHFENLKSDHLHSWVQQSFYLINVCYSSFLDNKATLISSCRLYSATLNTFGEIAAFIPQ